VSSINDPIQVHEIGPGKLIAERFEIRASHRQGGLSVAFEAFDREVGAAREVQFFPPSLFEGEQEAEEFARLWAPWKRVDSPNVLRVHEIALVGPDALLLVTDLPRGRSLRAVLDEAKRLSEDQVVRLGLQLLEGLAELHGQGLVHGDLKPQSVWVEGREPELGDGVLIDGGSTPGLWTAKDLGERTALIGTPYYAPVEQFGGEAPDVQSDLYNLATLLFELGTGVQPWRGRTFLEVFQAKLEREPPTVAERAPNVTLSSAFEAAVRGGLYADSEQRWSSAQAFHEALSAAS
jgi:serine/threonine protein kinase